MASQSKVSANGHAVLVQGFREGGGEDPYVIVAAITQDNKVVVHLKLSPEEANILGEELRKQAEFAQQEPVREKGE